MTQINTMTQQILTISLEDIGFLNIGGFDTPDAKTTGISGYGCPDCNEERPNNRLETQEDGTFWCCCCGVVWEMFNKSEEMTLTQKIKYIKTMKADPIFAAILQAKREKYRNTELTYCPVCDDASYWGAYGGSGAYGVTFCDYCDEQYDLERKEIATSEYHGSVFGRTK